MIAVRTVILAAVVLLVAGPAGAGEQQQLKTQRDKVSYSIGVSLANNFKAQGIDADLEMVIRGMRDALGGGKLLMPDDDVRAILTAYQGELRQKRVENARNAAEQNKKAGAEFLAANGKKEGVVTLPSGLQYKVIADGKGKRPADADSVDCVYRGTLISGVEFDRSAGGKPVTFKMSQVIPGWREALKLMPVGSKWQLFVPPHLAYGERGQGAIGPEATLVFEVELLGIK